MLSIHIVSRSPVSVYTVSCLLHHPPLLPPYVPSVSGARAASRYPAQSVLLLCAVAVLVKPQSEDAFQFWPPTSEVNLPVAPKTQQICTQSALSLSTARWSLWSLCINLRLAIQSSITASFNRGNRSWPTLWKQSSLAYTVLSLGRADRKAFCRIG